MSALRVVTAILGRCKLDLRRAGRYHRRPPRARITEPTGGLSVDKGPCTFVVVVGPHFDQSVPNAMMTCRMGYCAAFEILGVPYVIVDINDLSEVLPALIRPFCMILGADYAFMGRHTIEVLRRFPKFVWVNPWFAGSDDFFRSHGLDSRVWDWSEQHRRLILDSEPAFVYTATVESGLVFFEEWRRHGLRLVSLPLACDTTLYNLEAPYQKDFDGIRLAFVGGYWNSKGKQIDKYLRPFEDDLVIYGYNKWPYSGYRGHLSRELEPSLYRQALICPTINEPTVRLLHGQINERVFKVLGCRGMTVVDAVPAYHELFGQDELIVPQDEHEFRDTVRELLTNAVLRKGYSQRGYEAVVSRHTYVHRARVLLKELGFTGQTIAPPLAGAG